MVKKALITGITGQDASYLAELLLAKGYDVYGTVRRASDINTKRIDHIFDPEKRDKIHYAQLGDGSIPKLIYDIEPDEIYNLASMSHVAVSFHVPEYTAKVTGMAVMNLLEGVKNGIEQGILKKGIKFYQASSSEMYGITPPPQDEKTLMQPISPYGCAKLFGYHAVRTYRFWKGLNIFASNGILFNHESSRRGPTFVTRKITRAATRIKLGLQDKLFLGNLDALRDWGHSKDYCIDLDTQLLTSKGFKYRNELSLGDEIINFNKNNNKWEKDEIVKFHDIPFKGNMYIFKGNNLKFRCSENHKILYKRKTCKHKMCNDLKWKETIAKEMFNIFNNKSIRTKYDFCFPGFYGITNKKDYSIKDDVIKILGWLVTEGHLSKSKNIGGGVTLSVSQSKKKYYKSLKETLDNLSLTYREKEREDKLVEFILSAKSKDLILNYFENLDIHSLPNYIFSFSPRQLKILLNVMMLGDGSWANMSYYSANRKLAEDVQTISSLIGYRTSFKITKAKTYRVTLFSCAKKSKNNFITEIIKEKSEENIWCVETKKNKTIITKKEDNIFVSGNCRAMWMILQADKADDWVVSTGEYHTVGEFVEKVFNYLKLDPWKYIELSDILHRPNEVPALLGKSCKIRTELGWKHEIDFDELVKSMVDGDMKLAEEELKLKDK